MKKFISIIALIISINSLKAMDFKFGFWERENCQDLSPQCLPQSIDTIKKYTMPEPQNNSATKLNISANHYFATLLWTKRTGQGGYYSFQITLYDKGGELIGQCARYESLHSFEKAPVGSCSGFYEKEGKIIGASLYLPN